MQRVTVCTDLHDFTWRTQASVGSDSHGGSWNQSPWEPRNNLFVWGGRVTLKLLTVWGAPLAPMLFKGQLYIIYLVI